MTSTTLRALVVVRDGVLPAGALECIAECDGRVLLAGSGTGGAVEMVRGIAVDVTVVEFGTFRPGSWARALAPFVADESGVVLPASADGRDLAPRLAAVLQRRLHAVAISVQHDRLLLVRDGGRLLHEIVPDGPFVATLQPGVRGVDRHDQELTVRHVSAVPPGAHDADVEQVLAPDATTIDLTEATRIVAAGGGLDGPHRMTEVARVAAHLDASVGATRVITDRGWVDHQRQIGTTGVVVDPQLYVAFGISGAVQHTSGLGQPRHIISVNTDPSCPMMQLADLAVVADANAVLTELLAEVEARG